MAVNFGELDYMGHAPATEMKDKIRGIAYDAIREAFTNWPADEARGFLDEAGGIINMTEMICDQIDEEVEHKAADVQQILQKFEKNGKLEAGDTYAGNP